ncbi:uncharacterized protein [Typha angustifolia]|uniref:uncharacterized protein n=1 Tax=Typha angustifolia TaxID=59011 RepID=UPI003C3039D0
MPDRLVGEYITWRAFLDSFDQKYFLVSLRFELTREFTQLRQKNMTVAQCEDRFNALSRVCPRVIPNDAARADQFMMGLRIEICKQVNMVKNLTYAELVENTGIAERDLLEERSQRSSATLSRPSPQGLGGPSRTRPSISGGRSVAVSSSSSNGGFAWPFTPEGRMVGTMTLFAHTARIFFDPGATNSFISTSLLEYADVASGPLVEPLMIATPLGDFLEVRHVYRSCTLTFDEWDFKVDLLPLEMHDFDLILGMDWLAAYHASINCYSKEVILQLNDGMECRLCKDRQVDCSQLVAIMLIESTGTQTLTDLPVVQEFPDVFPEDI